MTTAESEPCRVAGCTKIVLRALRSEQLCLEHFLDHTLERVRQALSLCQGDKPLDTETVEWLFEDAHYTVQWLMRNVQEQEPTHQEKVLEVMLCLSNIHDYLRHHSVHLKPS